MTEDFLTGKEIGRPDRRALARVVPSSRIWAAVENETRREMLGMAEVADFSGLGLAVRGLTGDPWRARRPLSVTLVADEGIIPLDATLVHIGRQNRFASALTRPPPPATLPPPLYENARPRHGRLKDRSVPPRGGRVDAPNPRPPATAGGTDLPNSSLPCARRDVASIIARTSTSHKVSESGGREVREEISI